MKTLKAGLILAILFHANLSIAQPVSNVWSPDNLDGTYTNPIIHADYSDPDICQSGDDFFMTASSFNSIPGLPILHSKDLVNWTLINHAIQPNVDPYFDIPQHGKGVWAPSFREHNGTFYIYWGDPDRGIYMVHTDDPWGEWSAPVLVKKAHGNIDPSPLWDDDGRVYLVQAYAHTRAGIKSILKVVELSADGSHALDFGRIVFDGSENHPTLEGPKFYKRNGYYYIFAPGGGVTHGWQVVLRSKNIYGPYEDRIVLARGDTDVNGPHQGGLVELANGESWFVHFQDKDVFGRIVHLQPVHWIDDWPVMGVDKNNDGTGEPVIRHKKPDVGAVYPAINPQESDEFDGDRLGLQWQWNANPRPQWASLTSNPGKLRLQSVVQSNGNRNLRASPNLLTQKFPAENFQVTVKVDISGLQDNEEAGLAIYGMDYAALALTRDQDQIIVSQNIVTDADNPFPASESATTRIRATGDLWLRIEVTGDRKARYQFSTDGKKYRRIGKTFNIVQGRWVGAQIALYANRYQQTGMPGYIDVDWFRIEK